MLAPGWCKPPDTCHRRCACQLTEALRPNCLMQLFLRLTKARHKVSSVSLPRADSLTPTDNSNDDEPVARILTCLSCHVLASTSRLINSPTSETRCASLTMIQSELISNVLTLADVVKFRCEAIAARLSPSYHATERPSANMRSYVVLPARRGPKRMHALGGVCCRRSSATPLGMKVVAHSKKSMSH